MIPVLAVAARNLKTVVGVNKLYKNRMPLIDQRRISLAIALSKLRITLAKSSALSSPKTRHSQGLRKALYNHMLADWEK